MDFDNRNTSGVYSRLADLLNCRHQAKQLKLFARKKSISQLRGETRSNFRGRGLEFEEVRVYQPGDDIRSIDWRVSARLGKPYTKLFTEERERPVHLIIDQRNSMFFGTTHYFKSLMAVQIASYLAWASLTSSDRVGGQVFNENKHVDIRAKRNRHSVLKLLHNMHKYNHEMPHPIDVSNAPAINLAYAIETCRRTCRPGSAIFIISDCHDLEADAAKQLKLLSLHNDITIINITDPFELNLPIASGLQKKSFSITDGVESNSIHLTKTMSQRYQDSMTQHQERIVAICRRNKLTLIPISTEDSPFHSLRRIYN